MIDVKYKHKGLVEPLLELSGMTEMLEVIKVGKNAKVINMVDACKAHFSYSVGYYENAPIVVVTYDELSTKQIAEDMEALKGKDKVLIYPARDILFYNADVHSMDITAARLRVIDALIKEEDVVIILPVEALLNPLSPKETWSSYVREIKVGETLNISQFEARMVQMGYERVGRVEGMGQFAIRGGIIDFYGATQDEPYRIELWDDEIDSIRSFNVQTQRSINKVECVSIMPNQEIIFPLEIIQKVVPKIKEELKKTAELLVKEGKKESASKIKEQVGEALEQINNNISPRGLELYVPYTNLELVSILDYIPKNTLLVIDEPTKSREKSKRVLEEYRVSMEDRLSYGHILPKQIELIFEYEDVVSKMAQFKKLFMMNFDGEVEEFDISYTLPLRVYENNTFYKNLDLLEKDLKQWKKDKKRVIILSGVKAKAMRLSEELEQRG
ncbi:MAG: transcription-repair coupling factor, partial [Candidatus Cellulosilyticum pullistercoris]|nr:transcription-repair coupling factor [Candidatus Cellulosilyticum pullistercoris]